MADDGEESLPSETREALRITIEALQYDQPQPGTAGSVRSWIKINH